MAELAERARRVRESIMDHTLSDGVVPNTVRELPSVPVW